MAYADGELNGAEHAAERAQVEAALQSNPDLARRVEQHRELRRQLSATFDKVLDEPVPDRLVAAVRRSSAPTAQLESSSSAARESVDRRQSVTAAAQPSATATISDLSAARAERAASATRAHWSLPQWVALAASVVIGILIGHFALNTGSVDPIASRDGKLVAQASLADALSSQLASTQEPAAPIQIGTSFKNKSGHYCRTFVIQNSTPLGGLACREDTAWTINTLASAEAQQGDYRQAGSEMPNAIRAEVESQIAGDPLDASAEADAKANNWK